MILSKSEIKLENNAGFNKNFLDFIDLKNGDIITKDKGDLIVWGKTKKKIMKRKRFLIIYIIINYLI